MTIDKVDYRSANCLKANSSRLLPVKHSKSSCHHENRDQKQLTDQLFSQNGLAWIPRERRIMHGSFGSKASMRPSATEVVLLIQRICGGKIGGVIPAGIAI